MQTATRKDNRLDLDALDERMKAETAREREEARAKLEITRRSNGNSSLVEVEQSELDRLREENGKMRAAMNHFLEARNSAREFMTIWSDPRKLPELVQEVYTSHPDVQTVRQEAGVEMAQRASRLIAHMALTYQIHPLMRGMIYGWIQDGKLIVEIGYRGYGEMLKREVMDFETRAMTADERSEHGLSDKDRGWLCFVYDWERNERFTSRGQPAPAPYRGVGAWRAANPKKGSDTYPDPVPRSKSGDWVAEKNAIKDAARKALSFAVTKTAQADAIDFTYSRTDDAWVMPIETAQWLQWDQAVSRFEQLLAERAVADEEFTTYLGHNWRYTNLDPDAIKAKLDAYVAQREQAVEGAFSEQPEPNEKPAEVTAEKVEGKAKVCINCQVEPGEDTPVGFLCPTCARKLADLDAAQPT